MRFFNYLFTGLSIPLVSAALMFSGSTANAQLLEEVIVTAQKREQSMQDVGIAR